MNRKVFVTWSLILFCAAIALNWSGERWNPLDLEKPRIVHRHRNLGHPQGTLRSPASSKGALLKNKLGKNVPQLSELREEFFELESPVQVQQGLDELKGDESDTARELRNLLIRRWAAADPGAAAKWVEESSEESAKQSATEQVAVIWANADLAAAISWVQTLSDVPAQTSAILAIGYESARTEPLKGLELAIQLKPSGERNQLLSHLVSQWSANDFHKALGWVIQVEEPILREHLLEAVVVAGAEANGEASAHAASSQMAPGDIQDRAAVAIVQRWVQKSPEAAAAWVARFPTTPMRQAAEKELLSVATGRRSEAGN